MQLVGRAGCADERVAVPEELLSLVVLEVLLVVPEPHVDRERAARAVVHVGELERVLLLCVLRAAREHRAKVLVVDPVGLVIRDRLVRCVVNDLARVDLARDRLLQVEAGPLIERVVSDGLLDAGRQVERRHGQVVLLDVRGHQRVDLLLGHRVREERGVRHLAHEVPVGVHAKGAVYVLRSPVPLRQATVAGAVLHPAAEAHRPLGVDRIAPVRVGLALPVFHRGSICAQPHISTFFAVHHVVPACAGVGHARSQLPVDVHRVALLATAGPRTVGRDHRAQDIVRAERRRLRTRV